MQKANRKVVHKLPTLASRPVLWSQQSRLLAVASSKEIVNRVADRPSSAEPEKDVIDEAVVQSFPPRLWETAIGISKVKFIVERSPENTCAASLKVEAPMAPTMPLETLAPLQVRAVAVPIKKSVEKSGRDGLSRNGKTSRAATYAIRNRDNSGSMGEGRPQNSRETVNGGLGAREDSEGASFRSAAKNSTGPLEKNRKPSLVTSMPKVRVMQPSTVEESNSSLAYFLEISHKLQSNGPTHSKRFSGGDLAMTSGNLSVGALKKRDGALDLRRMTFDMHGKPMSLNGRHLKKDKPLVVIPTLPYQS